MSIETDLMKLYSQRILELAADIPNVGRLDAPSASVKKRAPLCGSTVTVDIKVEDGHISAFAQDVKACALGQAAASVVGAHAVGLSVGDVQKGRDQLYAMLKEDGPAPEAPFDGFEVLLPAKDYKNRHASIMLAIDATVEAFNDAS